MGNSSGEYKLLVPVAENHTAHPACQLENSPSEAKLGRGDRQQLKLGEGTSVSIIEEEGLAS